MANFIKKAIKHPGALTREAKSRGETVSEIEAHPPKNASPKTMARIRLARMLKGFNHKR